MKRAPGKGGCVCADCSMYPVTVWAVWTPPLQGLRCRGLDLCVCAGVIDSDPLVRMDWVRMRDVFRVKFLLLLKV